MIYSWGGGCEHGGFHFKEQRMIVGSGKPGEFPGSPVYPGEGAWTTRF